MRRQRDKRQSYESRNDYTIIEYQIVTDEKGKMLQ